MSIADIGPRPQAFDLETETIENPNYRTVAWSGKYLQVTLMSIPVGGDIGLEKHPDTDQFIRLEGGRGRAQMGPNKDELTFDQEVSDGWCVIVRPVAGTTSPTSVTSRCRSTPFTRRNTTRRARCNRPRRSPTLTPTTNPPTGLSNLSRSQTNTSEQR